METNFITYTDGSKWMEEQSKKYKSKGAFYGSDEYKEAYPKLKELYDAEHKETTKSAQKAMDEVGAKYGDRVSYSNITPFGFQEEYSGVIVERNGLPRVKFDEGQQTITGQKSVRWHKGWKTEKPKQLRDGGNTSIIFKSNLTTEQQKLVRTPAFKKWFGDWENSPETSSKVVDRNGEPLVVYHTTDKDFTVFDKRKSREGLFFSPNKERLSVYGKSKISSFFLNLRNPSHELFKIDIKYLISKGYDGIMDYGHARKVNEDLYEIICFYTNQMKLADGTNTTFDSRTNDIRFGGGGSIKSEGTFKSLGTAKELGITPNVEGHDMIAKCDCGERFSYQNSKKNIIWECPECNGMKRIS